MIILFVKFFVKISPYNVKQNYWFKVKNLGNGYDISILRYIHNLHPYTSRIHSVQLVASKHCSTRKWRWQGKKRIRTQHLEGMQHKKCFELPLRQNHWVFQFCFTNERMYKHLMVIHSIQGKTYRRNLYMVKILCKSLQSFIISKIFGRRSRTF